MKIFIETNTFEAKKDIEKVLDAIEALAKKYPHLIKKRKVEIIVKC